ncbi:ATP-binding Cassette (ABC) Superfamily, partial [Thraustotheca clavata]
MVTILNNISGVAMPGELFVLMGPSGAGKSSLLDVIAGRQKDYSGCVLVNGEKWTKQMNKLASYVMQDDVFYETLTVKEHLMFQAELRM